MPNSGVKMNAERRQARNPVKTFLRINFFRNLFNYKDAAGSYTKYLCAKFSVFDSFLKTN